MTNIFPIELLTTIYKILFVAGAIIYLIFAIIVLKQIKLMTSKVYDMFNKIIVAISWLHLFFAFLLVIGTILL